MNKVVLYVGLLLVGVVIIGAGAYLMTNRTPEEAPQAEEVSVQNQTFSGSFSDLLKSTENQVCTFESIEENGTATEGIVYVGGQGNKISGNFQVTPIDDDPFTGNIIRDAEYNYVWSTLQEQGAKIKISAESDSLFGEAADNVSSTTGISDSSQVDFDCNPWTVDETMFIPPTNVDFVDLTDSLNQLQNLMGGQCSACEQLPAGDTRNQCLQALNCN